MSRGGDFVYAFNFSLIFRQFRGGDFVYAHPEQGLGVGTLCTQSGDFVYAHPLLWLTAIREKWWLPEVLTRILTRRRGCGNGGYVDTCTEAVFSRHAVLGFRLHGSRQ